MEKIEKKKILEKEAIEKVVKWWREYKEGKEVLRESKPLERQIDRKIRRENPEIEKAGINLMLKIHVRSGRYLNNMITSKHRYSLEGEEVEEISEVHRKMAQGQLNKKKKRREEQEKQKKKKQSELKKKGQEVIVEEKKNRPTLSLKTARTKNNKDILPISEKQKTNNDKINWLKDFKI